MSITSLIFDFDGTLYPPKGYARRVLCRNLTSLRYLSAERKARKKLHGAYFASEKDFYEAFFKEGAALSGHSAEKFEKWYKKYLGDLLSVLQKHFSVYQEAQELFAKCAEKGIALYVYSDYNMTRERMGAIGIDVALFADIADSPSYGGLKPSLEAFDGFLHRNSIDSDTTLFIGDSEVCDRPLAEAAGMTFISVKDGNWDAVNKAID